MVDGGTLEHQVGAMKHLFLELQRRKVLRTVAAYAVIAWLIIQIVTVVFPILGIPEYVTTLIVVLMIAGFPVSVVISWFYKWTPEGFFLAEAADAAGDDFDPAATATGRQLDFVIITLMAVAIGWLVYDKLPGVTPEKSIAVLPFVNLSEDPDQDYFADGISEELLNALAKLPDLKVVARTSSFAFRGENRDISEIGRKLRVANVLEGSVRKAGGRLRITVQLIKADTGYQIWSETFDRDLADIFSVQDEISRAVARSLEVQLTGHTRSRPLVLAAASVDAYNLHLLGRYHAANRSVAELERARAFFEQAVKADPSYAPAYDGLVDTLLLLSNKGYGYIPLNEVLAITTPLITKALQIDSALAETHASLGLMRMMEGDFLAAEAALRRAVELSPNMARAHNWLYLTYDATARHREAFEALKRAFELDPLSPVIGANVSAEYWVRGQVENALQAANRVVQALPDHPIGYQRLGRIYWTSGDLAEALTWYRQAWEKGPDEHVTRRELGHLLVDLGRAGEARTYLTETLHEVALSEGKMAEALTVAREARAARPEDELGVIALARTQIRAGDYVPARELLEPLAPGWEDGQGALFARSHFIFWDPSIAAIDLAIARLGTGDEAGAKELLAASAAHFDHLRAEGLDHAGITWQEARILALEGQGEEAMAALERAIDQGWRSWQTSSAPALETLHGDPGFEALTERIRSLVAIESARLEETVRS